MGYSDTEMDESWSMTHIDSVGNRDELEAVDRLIDKIYGEVGSWEHWYDRELFRIYFGSHISLRQLSRDTKISLTSIHNSVKKYKIKLRERFGEDWEDFLNNQFDLI
jgi:transcriptional regulator of aromatic amino acid metabolism